MTDEQLSQIGFEFHLQTERFDQVVCGATKGKLAMPRTATESALSDKNVGAVERRLVKTIINEHGVSRVVANQLLEKAISSTRLEFNRQWKAGELF